jgi:superfamily II DNA/RNA helicase
VGTVGSVSSYITRRVIRGESIKILCVDEADEMLSQTGCAEIVLKIKDSLGSAVQVDMFYSPGCIICNT